VPSPIALIGSSIVRKVIHISKEARSVKLV
jgi:hypothetical protein